MNSNKKIFAIALTLSSMLVFGLGKALAAQAAVVQNPAVITESGPLNGIESSGVKQYLGIPYAAAPVGDLRWTPPQAFGRWQGLLQATQFNNACPQKYFGIDRGAEDCLYLNVYTPAKQTGAYSSDKLPVMVWIHGGGLVNGSGSDYNPAPLVKKGGVIVVTINYRLGVLGFFAHPVLDAEGHLNGNYGFMDQQFALQWLQRNITAFGGDPDRVTIFGESAGGLSVYSQLASPTAAGLFHGAIVQSGAYAGFNANQQSILPIASAEITGAGFAAGLGCLNQDTHCLRSIPASAIVSAYPFDVIYPVLDGTLLTSTPGDAFANGQFNQVPVITGSNHDEGRFFVYSTYDLLGNPLSDADYPDAVAKLLGLPLTHPLVGLAISVYPLTDYPAPAGVSSAPLAVGAISTDSAFACSARTAAQLLSQYVPTYNYEFDDMNAPFQYVVFGFPTPGFPMGAYHGAEVQYLMSAFGVPSAFTPEQQQLSDTMISYWTQFAKTGNPNASGSVSWEPYNVMVDQSLSLLPPTPVVESNFDVAHKCSTFWDLF